MERKPMRATLQRKLSNKNRVTISVEAGELDLAERAEEWFGKDRQTWLAMTPEARMKEMAEWLASTIAGHGTDCAGYPTTRPEYQESKV